MIKSTSFAALMILGLMGPVKAREFTLEMPYPIAGMVADPTLYESYALPLGPWQSTGQPVERIEGMKDRRAYRLDAPGASLLQIAGPLRDQLLAQGYELVLDCIARECGGFDFRFATEVMSEPAMHVDLADYRFVSAKRGDEAVSLMVSRSAKWAFVQVIRLGAEALPSPDLAALDRDPPGAAGPEKGGQPKPSTAPEAHVLPSNVPPLPEEMKARLDLGLSVALDDLVFASGEAGLAAGEFASLQGLVDWLAVDQSRRLVLVGHSDVSGGLALNIRLSKQRAAAVRQVLISQYGVAPSRLEAEGIGPLAPRVSNATLEDRNRNRRVEAVPAQL